MHTTERTGTGTATRHITVGPHGPQTSEEVSPQPGDFSDSESTARGDGSADVTQATRSYTVRRKALMTDKRTFQGAFSESPQEASGEDTSGAEATLDMSRSVRHIQLGPGETLTSEPIVFHVPISKAFALTGPGGSPEHGEAADGSQTQGHVALGPPKTSFTFQMDMSNVEATRSRTGETTFLFPTGTEAGAHSASDGGTWRDAGRKNDRAASVSLEGREQAEFDKTVQLQRMVDQRSVVSDDKKVAVLYLDHPGDEDEGDWF